MAFIAPEQREEEEQKGAGAPALSGTGAGSLTPGGTASAQGPMVSGGKSTSGQFVGINRYLDANRAKIPEYAGKLTGRANESADLFGNAASEIGQNFVNNVTSATPRADESLNKRSLTEIAGNERAKNAFLEQKNARYQGPRSISAEQQADLEAKRREAETRVSNLASPKAISSEIRQTSLNPTAGKTAFNAALVSGSPEARQMFQRNRDEQVASVNSRLQQLADQQRAAVEQATQRAADVSRETNARLGTETQGLESKVRTQAQALERERAANKSAVDAVLANGTVDGLSQEQNERAARELFGTPDVATLRDLLANLGQSRAQLGTLDSALAGLNNDENAADLRRRADEIRGNLDPRQYLRARGGDVSLETAASKDDFAKLKALRALSGEDTNVPLDLDQESTAGTGSADAYDFDYTGASGLAKNGLASIQGFLQAAERLKAKQQGQRDAAAFDRGRAI